MNKNRMFLVGSVVLLIGVFGGRAYFDRNQPSDDTSQAYRVDSARLVKNHSPIKGKKDAPLTIVEFLDPECEACRAMQPVMDALLDEFAGKVRVVIRYLPLHPNSAYASAALEETREIGKYEEALNLFYSRQPQWASHHDPKPEFIAKYLVELGVDKKKTGEEYLVTKHKPKLAIDLQDAKDLGLQQTPTFFVNGRLLSELGYEALKREITKELNDRK